MPIVGRPIWRLTEGKHIAKLEITWQLPRQPTQRRGNQLQKQKKTLTPATNGETSKMAESKMVAPTPDTKTAEPALNVAMCTTPTGPPRTPPGHSTPYAEDTTTDHSLQGEWKEVVSKKKKKKTSRKSPPPAKKEQPVIQQQPQRTPSPPKKKVQRIQSPLDLNREERREVGATKEYPLHEKYDLDEVVTDKLEYRDCRYVIIRAYRQRREETINMDLPAYFIYFIDDEPTWFFAEGPTSKSYYKDHYGDIERRFEKGKPCGNSVYLYDMLDRSSKGSDRTAPWIQKISPSCP